MVGGGDSPHNPYQWGRNTHKQRRRHGTAEHAFETSMSKK
jgi:hypothetical protein